MPSAETCRPPAVGLCRNAPLAFDVEKIAPGVETSTRSRKYQSLPTMLMSTIDRSPGDLAHTVSLDAVPVCTKVCLHARTYASVSHRSAKALATQTPSVVASA